MQGQVPTNMGSYEEQYTDGKGNPLIDEEGGAVIQPKEGFVIKTKDQTG